MIARVNPARGKIFALWLSVGRGRSSRAVAAIAPGDRVVDVGCGTGTAVRRACGLGASSTGVDPNTNMLRLARWITAIRRSTGASFLEGSAEHLPLPDESANVVWSISSVHHWDDRARGLAEAKRVLAPGGRLLLAERRVRQGATVHAGHGLTSEAAADLAREVGTAGFVETRSQIEKAGRRTLVVITARAPGGG